MANRLKLQARPKRSREKARGPVRQRTDDKNPEVPAQPDIPNWEREFRDVLEMSSGTDMPPLSPDEADSLVARERAMRRWVDAARSEAAVEGRSRLLFGEGQTKKQRERLLACHPLASKSLDRGIALYCFLKIQPLNFWPADVVRILGSDMLYQPFVAGALLGLSEIAQDPRTHINRYKPELIKERGLRAAHIEVVDRENPEGAALSFNSVKSKPGEVRLLELLKNLPPVMVDKILADDFEPEGLAKFARKQVLRTFQLLTARKAPLPKSRGRIRTLRSYELKRESGLSGKKAVAQIARQEGRSDSSVHSDIRHARAEIGIQTRPHRRRKPRL
jgi:hypothetical protein